LLQYSLSAHSSLNHALMTQDSKTMAATPTSVAVAPTSGAAAWRAGGVGASSFSIPGNGARKIA
jgi:hypothetical protein